MFILSIPIPSLTSTDLTYFLQVLLFLFILTIPGIDYKKKTCTTEKRSERLSYRGDTLRLSQEGHYLYVTTRGKTSSIRGFVAVWSVDPLTGNLLTPTPSPTSNEEPLPPLTRYETKTSGGKANAIEAFPFHPPSSASSASGAGGKEGQLRKDWIVLTDDEDGWVWILEWDGKELEEVAGVRLGQEGGEEKGVGASHAVWLS